MTGLRMKFGLLTCFMSIALAGPASAHDNDGYSLEAMNGSPDRQCSVYFDKEPEIGSIVESLLKSCVGSPSNDGVDLKGVIVIGYTDARLSDDESLKVSAQHAKLVRGYIIKLYPDAFVVMDARGETELAKPTEDGVSEPLNRRADVRVYVK